MDVDRVHLGVLVGLLEAVDAELGALAAELEGVGRPGALGLDVRAAAEDN